jgi:hypothetical protein
MFDATLGNAATPRVSLSFDVTGWTDDQVNRLRAAAAEIGGEAIAVPLADQAYESTGWTESTYVEAITRLLSKYHVQVQAIFEAVKSGEPFVSRERIYEIGAYPASRSLKGFTRPVNRVQQDLVDEGLLPEDAVDLLETAYDPAIKGYQRAIGFRVPVEVIQIAREAKSKQDAKAS